MFSCRAADVISKLVLVHRHTVVVANKRLPSVTILKRFKRHRVRQELCTCIFKHTVSFTHILRVAHRSTTGNITNNTLNNSTSARSLCTASNISCLAHRANGFTNNANAACNRSSRHHHRERRCHRRHVLSPPCSVTKCKRCTTVTFPDVKVISRLTNTPTKLLKKVLMMHALLVKQGSNSAKALNSSTDDLSSCFDCTVTKCSKDALVNSSIGKCLVKVSKPGSVARKVLKSFTSNRTLVYNASGKGRRALLHKSCTVYIKQGRRLFGLLSCFSASCWGVRYR